MLSSVFLSLPTHRSIQTIKNRFKQLYFGKTSTPMAQYIGTDREIDAYSHVEDNHAGRLQARIDIIAMLKKMAAEKIVEMGTGPGNSLKHLLRSLPKAHFTGVECDSRYLAETSKTVASFLNQKQPRVTLIQSYIQDFIPKARQDAFVALGAFTDLSKDPKDRINFLKNQCAKVMLKPGGTVFLEEEIFPTHNPGDPKARARAAWVQRGDVILDALLQNQPEKDVLDLAKLELKALISSLHDIGDHKATLSGMLSELKEAGLEDVTWKKVWPLSAHQIADQNPEDLNIDSVQDPDSSLCKTQLWDYYSTLILKTSLAVNPTGNIDTDPQFLKGAQAIEDCYREFQAIKAKTKSQPEFLKALATHGLKFKKGQDLFQGTSDTNQDKDGGVYVFTAKTPGNSMS